MTVSIRSNANQRIRDQLSPKVECAITVVIVFVVSSTTSEWAGIHEHGEAYGYTQTQSSHQKWCLGGDISIFYFTITVSSRRTSINAEKTNKYSRWESRKILLLSLQLLEKRGGAPSSDSSSAASMENASTNGTTSVASMKERRRMGHALRKRWESHTSTDKDGRKKKNDGRDTTQEEECIPNMLSAEDNCEREWEAIY